MLTNKYNISISNINGTYLPFNIQLDRNSPIEAVHKLNAEINVCVLYYHYSIIVILNIIINVRVISRISSYAQHYVCFNEQKYNFSCIKKHCTRVSKFNKINQRNSQRDNIA